MSNFSNYFSKGYNAVAAMGFDFLATFSLCAFAAVFVITLLACVLSERIKKANKKPFLYFLNAYTLIVFAVFLVGFNMSQAAAATAIFYFAGYLLYGCLCLITKRGERAEEVKEKVISAMPVSRQRDEMYPDVPAAKNNVRLEHALAISDKLLTKNISKGDRQELEKMKTTLTILQIKGTLTPQEGEILNDNFNALLKLMAKYNL
jgi:Ca2+/Na+ antiporter